jgi:GT2 family glycosyltransferase
VLCQNNDTLFEPDYVSTLVAVSRERGGALVGSVLRSRDDGSLISFGPKIFWRSAAVYDLTALVDDPDRLANQDVIESLDALPGRGMLVPVRVFRRIGTFRRFLLPHYIADYEFSARANRRGEQLVLSTRAAVYTAPSSASSSVPRGVLHALRTLFSRRSNANVVDHLIFFAVSGPVRTRPRALLAVVRGAAKTLAGAVRVSCTSGPPSGTAR